MFLYLSEWEIFFSNFLKNMSRFRFNRCCNGVFSTRVKYEKRDLARIVLAITEYGINGIN